MWLGIGFPWVPKSVKETYHQLPFSVLLPRIRQADYIIQRLTAGMDVLGSRWVSCAGVKAGALFSYAKAETVSIAPSANVAAMDASLALMVRLFPEELRLLLRASLAGHVTGDETAVRRQVIREERAQPFDVVAPVAVQLAGDAEPAH